MCKITIADWRNPEVSVEDCRRWWIEEHAPMAKRMPGPKGYVINLAQKDENGDATLLMGTDDLFFDSEEAFQNAWESEKWSEARDHTAACGVKAVRSTVHEVRIIDPELTGVIQKEG